MRIWRVEVEQLWLRRTVEKNGLLSGWFWDNWIFIVEKKTLYS